MNQNEKCEMLKSTIEKLYTNEGRSKLYISNLLGLNRKIMSEKISAWGLKDPVPVYHMNPSTEKFLNANRDKIKSQLDHDVDATDIARELNVSRDLLTKVLFKVDPVLKKANDDKNNRTHSKAAERREEMNASSRLNYDMPDLPGEVWRDILGYPGYQVSNKGRVRSYKATYNEYCVLSPNINQYHGRAYACLSGRTLSLPRLVAHAFCPNFSDVNCTVDHIDGNPLNNDASNLRWVSQSENNKHAYELGRPVNRYKGPIPYTIIYKGQYCFKTIEAFARFAGISWTQASRWLDEPLKHDLVLEPK